jgi:transcriptional regulator with XRE-family HTH domain
VRLLDIGDMLKAAREARGLTLDKVESETKIRRKYISAMEQGEFETLPGPVYARAFLKNYAKYLNIDTVEITEALKEIHPGEDVQAETAETEDKKAVKKPGLMRYWMYLAAVLLIAAVAVSIYYGARSITADRGRSGEGENQAAVAVTPQDNTLQQAPLQDNSPKITGVNVVLNVKSDRSWTNVIVDGIQVFQGEIKAGESKSFEGKEIILVTLGNAGAVEVLENGKSIGFLGALGEVVEHEFKAPAVQ